MIRYLTEGDNDIMTGIETKSINAIRILSADAIQKANSGHPGLPLGAAPMAYELWAKHMRHNPADPKWENRDRFILSGGHGSMLLYSLLHLFGYGLTVDDLSNFRQFGSLTPGHPEYGHTVGVEATTGPLGAGMAMATGMAIAEKHLATVFNKEGFPVVPGDNGQVINRAVYPGPHPVPAADDQVPGPGNSVHRRPFIGRNAGYCPVRLMQQHQDLSVRGRQCH